MACWYISICIPTPTVRIQKSPKGPFSPQGAPVGGSEQMCVVKNLDSHLHISTAVRDATFKNTLEETSCVHHNSVRLFVPVYRGYGLLVHINMYTNTHGEDTNNPLRGPCAHKGPLWVKASKCVLSRILIRTCIFPPPYVMQLSNHTRREKVCSP